jgi:ornithine cyclodeaminase
MIIVTESVAKQVVGVDDAIAAVEAAFRAYDQGQSAVFDVARGTGSDPSHAFAVKSGREGSIPRLGLKSGSYCPANRLAGRAAHSSTVLLIDDRTGAAHALVAANHLNGMRTAASDALAVRHLARSDARILSVVGAGHQAVYEVEAIMRVRPIEAVLVATRSAERLDRFCAEFKARTGLDVQAVSLEEAARLADILVTVTPSVAPLIAREWVKPGTHISAMGADAVGKQELAIDLVAVAQVYVDVPAQARSIGECQHAFAAGLLGNSRIERFTLGGLVSGRLRGRADPDPITLFDSSGMALQDIAVANLAASRAAAAGLAVEIDMLSEGH